MAQPTKMTTQILEEEVWKDIAGYEGLYQVSNFGKVKSMSVKRGKVLKQNNQNNGYLTVSLSNNGSAKTATVHRLVAKAFIPNPENLPQVNHIDSNKGNNSVKNLHWCTASENSFHHCRTHNVSLYNKAMGERVNTAKLTVQKVLEIRALSGIVPHSELALRYGVSKFNVTSIINKKSWKHI